MKLIPSRNKLTSFRKELDSLSDSFFSPSFLKDFNSESELAFEMDVSEEDNSYNVKAELPGLDEKDIEISIEGSHLVIKGEKKEEKENKRKNYHYSEIRYGAFMRSINLPKNVDSEAIKAEYKNGILNINIPKSANSPKRKTIIVNKGI